MVAAPIPATLRAAIYTRVSTLEQGEHGYGLESQLKDCQRLAAELDTRVVATFEDRDSGASWTLPGLNAMLDGAQRSEFDMVIIYDPDRLSRRMAKYVVLEQELKRAGVQLRFVTIRTGDTPEDRVLQQMKAVFAEYDYERTVLRMMRGKRTKAERGLVVGTGVAPYGYRYLRNEKGRAYALELDPDTAPIVRRLFEGVRRMSIRKMCDQLNAEGIPTYFGARASTGWYPATVMQILTNPVYLGTAPYGRRDGKKQWQDPASWVYSAAPAIVDRATWDAAHEALKGRRVRRQRSARSPEAEARYPLRGMLACGHCGGALACEIQAGYRFYGCLRHKKHWARSHGKPQCVLCAVPGEAIEKLAWDHVAETLMDDARLAEGLARAQAEYATVDTRRTARLADLDQETARLRGRLSRILDEQLDAPTGSESARLLREKAQQIEQALAKLQGQRAEMAATPHAGLSPEQATELRAFAAKMRRGLDKATPVDRRALFQDLQVRATIWRDDEHGRRLGRFNRFTVHWTAAIPLRCNDLNIVNIKTVFVSNASGTSVSLPQAAE